MTNRVSGQQFDSDEEKLLEDMAEHWRKVWNETPVQAIARLEDAAKQMITITAGLQGLYVALFAFSNLRMQISATQWVLPGWLLWLVFLLPLACWLVSLIYATRVFVPRIHPGVNFNEVSVSAWQKVKDVYGQAAEEKLRWLQRSHRWLIVSFVFTLLAVILFILLPTPKTEPTPIIIVTPTPTSLPKPTP